MKKTTSKDIEAIVWKACDTFRGIVDPAQYKDYILTMLFLKYLSDLWKEKQQQYLQKYDGDQMRVQRALRNERFQVPENSTFDYLLSQRNADNLGELINIALELLEDANNQKLSGVFRSIDFNSESELGQIKDRNRRLQNLLDDFSALDLEPSHLEGNDVMGDTYEYLIDLFAGTAGKKAGEFYTPKTVSILLAKLVHAEAGSRIYDPSCGSGSLLIKAAKEVGNQNFSLYGQEINGSTWALARMNMFLHEIDNADIRWGDTLNNPLHHEVDQLMRFDVVVANPPFSLDKWGADQAASDIYGRYDLGIPPKSKGDYAFILHMLASTNESGRMGVIMPHGVLFRGGSEGKIRERLIEENLLEAVIGLPQNLFYGAAIPVCIIMLNKQKRDNEDVLFIDASQSFEAAKNQNLLQESDIEKILQTYRSFKEAAPLQQEQGMVLEEKYAYRATLADIREQEYNLNIPRYVDTFEEEAPIDIPTTQKEIGQLKQELNELELKMQGFLSALGF